MSTPTAEIYPDVSRTDHVKDFCKRGVKSVLVRKHGADVDPEAANNYNKVELMDPVVKQYCAVYTEDLVERVGLNDKYLSPLFTTHVLLNPMFGLRSRVVNAGLLMKDPYLRGKRSE